MSPRRKETPMKYWGFYCDEKLKQEVKEIVKRLDENDSEFIHKAVKERISNYQLKTYPLNEKSFVAHKVSEGIPFETTHRDTELREVKTSKKSQNQI